MDITPRKMYFPPELCDNVVDHLWDDRDALGVCGLTCSVWLSRSRMHLFHTVCITCERYAKLATLLQDSPHLSQYVRDLDIEGEGGPLLPILQVLKQLRKLTIRDWNADRWDVDSRPDTTISLLMLHTLSLILCSPPFPVLLRLICSCPKLSTLDVDQSGSANDLALESSPSIGSMHIHRLIYQRSGEDLWKWLMQSGVGSRIRWFEREWSLHNRFPGRQQLLDAVGPTINHLALRLSVEYVPYAYGMDFAILDLSRCRSLSSLHLHIVKHKLKQRDVQYDSLHVVLWRVTPVHTRLERIDISIPTFAPMYFHDDLDIELSRIAGLMLEQGRRLTVTFTVTRGNDRWQQGHYGFPYKVDLWNTESVDFIVGSMSRLRGVKSRLRVVTRYNDNFTTHYDSDPDGGVVLHPDQLDRTSDEPIE